MASQENDGRMGFVLGTGTNVCYSEQNANIKKSATLKQISGETIINVESGEYNKFKTGVIDDEFDKTTCNPERQRFERIDFRSLSRWIVSYGH